MMSSSSAFKTQNEKRYGSVEKMYIHFYTFTCSDTLDFFWYCNDTENIELFSDFKHYLHTLKSYGQCSNYTGDIFVVKNLHKFKEILILLGAREISKSNWPLVNNISKEVHTWRSSNNTQFNELFDICFQDYDIINSFSSEPSLSKTCVEMDIPFYDIGYETNSTELIMVTVGDNIEFMKYYNFNQLCYTNVKSKVDNATLMNWFDTFVKKSEYKSACTIIKNLMDFNSKEEDTTPQVYDDLDADDVTVLVEQESAKISHNDWILLFCELYLEEDKIYDILLSDIYQMYLTASSWSSTATVSMATFIKRLRAFNRFTIKRRSKGMMVIGFKCLVGQQAELFQQVKKGQLYKRQLLQYKSDLEINQIITKYKSDIESIGYKYTREAFILLNDSAQKLNYQTVAQFVSIPQISTQLGLYAEYIDSILKNIPECETSVSDTRVRKFNTDVQKPLEDFRELGNKCTLYNPFVLGNYNISNKPVFTYDLKKSTDTIFEPNAFNEHFGMFASSKEYHLFESEKELPQSYNNSMGTSLESIINPISSTKDFSIWKEGSRVVPNFDLRATGKLS
jgi:hypothetical protein